MNLRKYEYKLGFVARFNDLTMTCNLSLAASDLGECEDVGPYVDVKTFS
jgi:hypothetical protein